MMLVLHALLSCHHCGAHVRSQQLLIVTATRKQKTASQMLLRLKNGTLEVTLFLIVPNVRVRLISDQVLIGLLSYAGCRLITAGYRVAVILAIPRF